MATTFICQHCNESKPANHRLKGHQQYCEVPACQRARKAAWQKNKMANAPQYRAQQTQALVDWRKKRPLNQYQTEYRQNHPEYVQRNRELQKKRNQKRSRQLACLKIVKMDAYKKSPSEKSTSYLMTPYSMNASGKIVKMDALIIQLADLQQPISDFLSLTS